MNEKTINALHDLMKSTIELYGIYKSMFDFYEGLTATSCDPYFSQQAKLYHTLAEKEKQNILNMYTKALKP